jgi:Protein of unknown function (DUF2867)
VRIPHAEFLALDLEAHALLKGVPLRDVSVVDLPDGGDDRTIADVRRLMEGARRRPPLAVRALVGLRLWLGRVFHWDGPQPEPAYASRLSDDQRRRTLAPIGSASGPLRLLYEFPYEMLAEARNATVHAFSCMALRQRPGGYRLYWAIYVENVSAFTPLYMAAIEPFRRFVVYPATLASIRKAWTSTSRLT